MKNTQVITKMLSGKGCKKIMTSIRIFPPSAYISFSELKDGETFTFRYGDREHRFTDHIYMCVDENYVGERTVIDLTVFNCFYIGNYEEIDVRRVKYKIVAEDDEKEIVEKLYDVIARLKDLKRMCKAYDACIYCPMSKAGCASPNKFYDNADEIVDKWISEHPVKTYAEEQ